MLIEVKTSQNLLSPTKPAEQTERQTPITTPEADRKRKRSQEPEDSPAQVQDVPSPKRTRISTGRAFDQTERHKEIKEENRNPIKYWAENGSWPKQHFEMDPNVSELTPKKRSRSTSYSQSVKEGNKPRPYTPKYEEVLANAGIFMDAFQGQTNISNDCQELCNILLSRKYDPPIDSLFKDDRFWVALQRVRNRNESRVFRDITPFIVPSAELLYIRGLDHLEHLTEELNAEWTKCTALAGPRPKPDFCVGLSSSAFTEEEVSKLKLYTAPNRATLVTEQLYFPYFMCEVKCGDQAIIRADRQNAHSCSIAVGAIIQLYQASSHVEEVNRKLLAFSVSHDVNMAKIYGHYADVKAEKTTFHRYLIRSFDFTERNGLERYTAYNFVRKLYDHFTPIHLKRIQSALSEIPNPSAESFTPTTSIDADVEGGLVPPDIPPSVPSSQDSGVFKRPALPLTAVLQQENDRLTAQLDQLMKQQREQQEQITKLLDLLTMQQKQKA